MGYDPLWLAVGQVLSLSYQADRGERGPQMESLELTLRESNRIECRITFSKSGKDEYWTFRADTLRLDGDRFAGELHDIELGGTHGTTCRDDRATGTLTYCPHDGEVRLDVRMRIDRRERVCAIRWQTPSLVLAGRTFRALVSQSCSRTVGGGFMSYTFCELRFGLATVAVSTFTQRRGSSEEEFVGKQGAPALVREYAWREEEEQQQKQKVIIDGFTPYGILEICDTGLCCDLPLGGECYHRIVFEEVPPGTRRLSALATGPGASSVPLIEPE